MKNVKLLHPFANVMGIFFPVGKLKNGGTCEFATERCLKECCAIHPGKAGEIKLEIKKEIYKFFCKVDENSIVFKILGELATNECKILTWFVSGDCPSELTNKFYNIVRKLDEIGIIQTGFTRNKELWKSLHINIYNTNYKVLLTIENTEEIDNLYPRIGSDYSYWLFSMPNYEKGCIDIYYIETKHVHISSGCGGGYYEDHVVKKEKVKSHLELDCKNCFEKKLGCFIELPLQKKIRNY